MSIEFKEYSEAEKELKRIESNKQKDIGRVEQLEKQLCELMGTKTVALAKKKLVRLKRQQQIDEKDINKKIRLFRKKYKDELAKLEGED